MPTIAWVYDRKHRANAKKEGMVEMRISFERKSKYISTGVSLFPKQWKGYVTARADAAELNDSLDALLRKARNVVTAMMDEGELCLDEIPARLKSATEREDRSFIDYCRKRITVRIYGKSDDTRFRYERFVKWLTEWHGIVHFSDVTDANIVKMDAVLVAKGMKNYSKWNNYHRFMNSFILDAIDDGLLKRNPYKWVHIRKDKTCGIEKYLTLDEMRRIERAVMPTKSLERVRDLFVFQTYTCLSYTDLRAFDANKIYNKVYEGKRGKTGQGFAFMMLSGARRILEKYDGKLPIISNVKYNQYLKVVAQMAKIDKPISSHWARHTGATILLNDGGVDIEVVAKILGHSSTTETRRTYSKLLSKTVVNAMTDAEERLEAKSKRRAV